jgi:hypothetical protein
LADAAAQQAAEAAAQQAAAADAAYVKRLKLNWWKYEPVVPEEPVPEEPVVPEVQ